MNPDIFTDSVTTDFLDLALRANEVKLAADVLAEYETQERRTTDILAQLARSTRDLVESRDRVQITDEMRDAIRNVEEVGQRMLDLLTDICTLLTAAACPHAAEAVRARRASVAAAYQKFTEAANGSREDVRNG